MLDETLPPSSRTQRILTLNRGSSSIKFALFAAGDPPVRLLAGEVERIGVPESSLTVYHPDGGKACHAIDGSHHASTMSGLTGRLDEIIGHDAVTAVGHRVVHGGPDHFKPQRVTPELLADLRGVSPFAPEHLPIQIELIESIGQWHPSLPQVACFDTAFHAEMPRVVRLLPISRRFEAMGVRRYGFHGLSYAYLMEELARVAGAQAAGGRVILAHLGNGASMAAVRDGKGIDTSMALTPASGFPMNTRSGDIDPGLVWFLSRVEGMTTEQFYEMANRRSGLLGISETSADMRDLLAKQASDSRAAEAIELFCYYVRKWLGGFTAVLGGLDTLIFSGGIGEHAAEIRARICEGLEYLGIVLEAERNAANAGVISADKSPVTVRVIKTDEESMIAKSVLRVLSPSQEVP